MTKTRSFCTFLNSPNSKAKWCSKRSGFPIHSSRSTISLLVGSPSQSTPLGAPFRTPRRLFVFPPFFSVCTKFTLKKEKLAKSILLNASDAHENFFLNRCGIKYYAIFSGHIGDGYREIQETGAHRWDLQTFAGVPRLRPSQTKRDSRDARDCARFTSGVVCYLIEGNWSIGPGFYFVGF